MTRNSVSKKTILMFSSVGGALEMYDFVIYIFFAATFAKIFFPAEEPLLGMMSSLAIFATGYLFRPFGGVLFGHLGDRYGRRAGLLVTIIIMGCTMILMALMPTYHQVGLFAPVAFCVLRLLQGLALGGDLPGAMTFVAEYTDDKYRGLFMGYLFLGVNLGLLLASFSGMLFTNFLTAAQLTAWGWRIAFLIGTLLFVIGIFFRKKNIETPIFQHIEEKRRQHRLPFWALIKEDWFKVIRAILMSGLQGVVVVQLFLYMPVYLSHVVKISTHTAMIYTTLNVVIFSAMIPMIGALSDKIGRKPLLILSALFFLFCTFPVYRIIDTGRLNYILMAYLLFDFFSAIVVSTVPTTLTEIFDSRVRNSGVGVSYNIGFGVLGGLSPLLSTYFIFKFNEPAALSINLMLVSLALLLFIVPMRFERMINADS